MYRIPLRRTVCLALTCGLIATSLAACTGDSSNGKIVLTVNGLPPKTEKANHKKFLDDVAEFEKLNPDIDIQPHEGKMDPKTFTSRLAGGQLEDVFYVYFTDPANLIAKHQAADISEYVDDFDSVKLIRKDLMRIFTGPGGAVYGLPAKNYSLGLLYNRALFTKAGLDPDRPPTTWDDVRSAAAKIAKLGGKTAGYGDYSTNNTGGWHFTAELYSMGGKIAVKHGKTYKAAFNDSLGRKVLQNLSDMRWKDHSMGARQQLDYDDLLRMMGSGKLGMYVATGDNIPIIVQQYDGHYKDYGLGPIPDGAGTLAGGEGYMFNPKDTPDKIRAGLKWLTFAFDNPDRIDHNIKWESKVGNPVGLPQPAIWTGDADKSWSAALKTYANVPRGNYKPFVDGMAQVPIRVEPPKAQQVYAVLDEAMNSVLTDEHADIGKLLDTAEADVNTILAEA